MQNIFGCIYVCDKETWIGGAYSSYCLNSPCEARVFACNALARDDASVHLIFVCGCVETTPLSFAYITFSIII